MMNAHQLLTLVVRPTLEHIGLKGRAAEQLVMGTIYKESLGGTFLKQYPTGPALGIGQMEPATERDIWNNFLKYNSGLRHSVSQLLNNQPRTKQLITNLAYAVAMTRIHYYRVPKPLPKADDIQAMGEYWDKYYNCNPNVGFPSEFVKHFPKEAFNL